MLLGAGGRNERITPKPLASHRAQCAVLHYGTFFFLSPLFWHLLPFVRRTLLVTLSEADVVHLQHAAQKSTQHNVEVEVGDGESMTDEMSRNHFSKIGCRCHDYVMNVIQCVHFTDAKRSRRLCWYGTFIRFLSKGLFLFLFFFFCAPHTYTLSLVGKRFRTLPLNLRT